MTVLAQFTAPNGQRVFLNPLQVQAIYEEPDGGSLVYLSGTQIHFLRVKEQTDLVVSAIDNAFNATPS